MEKDSLTQQVIGCAIEVHKALGPGLLESTYERCFQFELAKQGIEALTQVSLPVNYKGLLLDAGYRIDLLIPDKLIIELKAVESLKQVHQAQLITYMKLSGITKGLLINFNVSRLVDGVKRLVL